LSANKKKINVLDLRDSPWVDGPGRTILDCASSIEGERYHFLIGAFSGGKEVNAYAEEAVKRGLEIVVIPERSSFDFQIIRKILAIIDQYDIGLIHTHDFRSNIFGLLCAKQRKIPVVSTVHGWIANNLKGRIYNLADKIALRFFNKIIAVSKTTQRKIVSAFIPSSRVSVINNALILEDYSVASSNSQFRKELNVDGETKLIANIGRLSPEKGQFIFLQAAKEILNNNKKIRFILIGIGPEEKKLREYVKTNNMDAFVVFAGFRHDMINIYNSIDLVVQSSYTEGMPNVVLEALLMKVPVIATNVGGTGDIITSGQTGTLIEAGSLNMLVTEIANYLDKPDSYVSMTEHGRELIVNEFNHNERAKKLVRLYDEVLD
jgi:glycosyltransferase involved in cell wall biosynthesis